MKVLLGVRDVVALPLRQEAPLEKEHARDAHANEEQMRLDVRASREKETEHRRQNHKLMNENIQFVFRTKFKIGRAHV